MFFAEEFQPFIDESPVSVMFRGTLENVFTPERLNRLFEQFAEMQYDRDLAFSTCAELLSLVVLKTQRSVNAAYRVRRKEIAVSVQAVYRKLAGIEPAVCEALVRETGRDMAQLIEGLNARLPGPLPGFEVRIADGNHLAGTQHRLKELRHIGDAPLPGHTLAVLNPHLEIIEDLVVCRDGHANQKPLSLQLLERVQAGQCWIADRDYSSLPFLLGIDRLKAYFLIRQHGALKGQPVGRRRRIGRIETGVVFEQKLRLTDKQGQQIVVRRMTVQLDSPTRDGDTEIHLLSNLPAKVRAQKIAMAYLSRWSIEAAFAKLTTVLRCELNTLGYPEAALFGFCIAVVTYNAVSTVIAALRVAHPQATSTPGRTTRSKAKFSFYYLADEIAGVWRGMAIAVPAEHWTATFAGLNPKEMARRLLWLARRVEVERFLTNPYGPQQRRRPKQMSTPAHHVSTYRLLEQRKQPSKSA